MLLASFQQQQQPQQQPILGTLGSLPTATEGEPAQGSMHSGNSENSITAAALLAAAAPVVQAQDVAVAFSGQGYAGEFAVIVCPHKPSNSSHHMLSKGLYLQLMGTKAYWRHGCPLCMQSIPSLFLGSPWYLCVTSS